MSGPNSLPPKVRVAAYEEAADVLAGMLPAGPGRRRVLMAVAACWGLGADAADHTVRLIFVIAEALLITRPIHHHH